MDASQYKYRGFISYSHQDRRWGEWLHRTLEAYRVPARLVGTQGQHGPLPKRLFPIFRDREELSTAGALADALQRALADSHCFLLVCSPAAAASRWVNEEILQFKRLGGEGRILCLIVDGEPHASNGPRPERECFPPALRYRLGPDGELSDQPAEPLAADARDGGDGRDNAKLKLIAGLLGVSFGELRQRDLQARNRRLGFIAAITTGVAALTIVLAVQAVLARRAAEKSRQQGEDLIGFMLGDLRAKLEPLGKLEILDAVGDKAMGYFDQLDSRNLSEAALTARAKALRQIGDVRFSQGRPAEAGQAITAALLLNRELTQRHPDDVDLLFELGQTEYWVAFAAWRADQLDRAGEHFEAYRQISQQLVDRDPKNSKWALELGYSETNLAALNCGRGQYEAALDHARRSAALWEAIEPKNAGVRRSLSNARSWQGTALQSLGRLKEAIAILRVQAETMRSLGSDEPDDMLRKSKLGGALSALGFAALSGNDAALARKVSAEGLGLVATLEANDASNESHHYLKAAYFYIDAGAKALEGAYPEAERDIAKSRTTLTEILARDPDLAEAKALLLASEQSLFDLALMQQQLEAARTVVRQRDALCAEAKSDDLPCARMLCAVGNSRQALMTTLIERVALRRRSNGGWSMR